MSQAIRERLAANQTALRTLADKIDAEGYTDEHRAEADRLKGEIKNDTDALALVDEARSMKAPAPAAADASAELRAAAAPATVTEQRLSPEVVVEHKSVYAKENRGESWFRDLFTLRDGDAAASDKRAARERLDNHYAAERDENSAHELRAYSSTTDSQGGYLVSPAYINEAFVDYRQAGRVAANLVHNYPLPAKTDSVNIPTMDGATAVAIHTENGAVTETSATFTTVAATVARMAGMATLPNFLLDRSLPGADMIVLGDLAKSQAYQTENVVLNSTTTSRKGLLQESGLGGATATAATPTIATYWPAFLNAYNDVASGIFAPPTAVIMHPRRWAYLASLLDSSNRPLIASLVPQNAAGRFDSLAQQEGAGGGVQAVGSILGMAVYLSALIPTTNGAGTNEDTIIVLRPEESWLMETAPKFAVSFENQFGKDQAVCRVTSDIAFTAARRKASISLITGTANAATV